MSSTVEKKGYPGVSQERLGIEVTTQCNMACGHCFARAGIAKPSSLSLDLTKAIIAEGYEVGYRHLHITGGEPLIWQSLFSVLDYAYKIGYQTIFLNTNGTLLTTAITSRLASYQGLMISVSLESTEAFHDSLRGQGSYQLTLKGIENALDAGIDLTIFSIACKSVLSKLHRFAEHLYNIFPSVSYLTLLQLVPAANGDLALSDELLAPEDFLKLIETVALLNLLGLKTRFLFNPLAYAVSKLLKILWVPRSLPLYSEGSIIIMANSDICLSHSSKYSFGNYTTGMIGKILASEAYRQAVAPDEKTCPACKYYRLCTENGMDRPMDSYWDTQSDEHYCQHLLNGIKGESMPV